MIQFLGGVAVGVVIGIALIIVPAVAWNAKDHKNKK